MVQKYGGGRANNGAQGFCFMINVAMSASNTLSTCSKEVNKIVITYVDAHHGNRLYKHTMLDENDTESKDLSGEASSCADMTRVEQPPCGQH